MLDFNQRISMRERINATVDTALAVHIAVAKP